MSGIFFAITTVIVWGLWLSPSQTIPFKNQQIKTFYVAVANFLLAFFIGLAMGFNGLTPLNFLFPFVGGVIWAVSGYYAFLATNRLGIARAIGIWAPLNILVSIGWGILLFGEFLKFDLLHLLLAISALGLILVGITIIIFSQDTAAEKETLDKEALPESTAGSAAVLLRKKSYYLKTGIAGAVMAGILWGSYFIPIRISRLSMWLAAFPLAAGILAGSTVLVLFSKQSVILKKPTHYLRVAVTGLLWGVGNYTSLKMMELLGTGKGFTIAQLSVALNALASIFIFKQPHPRSKAALFTILGIALALAGGILLGSLK
jgi:glucose uptake protein